MVSMIESESDVCNLDYNWGNVVYIVLLLVFSYFSQQCNLDYPNNVLFFVVRIIEAG